MPSSDVRCPPSPIAISARFSAKGKREADPDVKAERAVRGHLKRGMSRERAVARTRETRARKAMTPSIARHGGKVDPDGSPDREVTNILAIPAMGVTTGK